MAEPGNLVLVQLRSLRETMESLKADHAALEKRFNGIRKAVEGEPFMGRVTAAEIEEQLAAMDARLQALESQNR